MDYKKSYWLLFVTLFVGCLFGLLSCQSNIEVATEAGFKVVPDEYREKVSIGSSNKIRIQLKENISLRDNYYVVKYFSAEGDGRAYYNKELNEFKVNVWVIPTLEVDPITGDKFFTLVYAPYSHGSHRFSLTVRDGFGNEEKVDFKFSVEKPN